MLSELAVAAENSSPEITSASVESRVAWEEAFAKVALPHFTQSWAYGEGKRTQGWSVERLVFSLDQEPVAICQLLVKRVLGIPVVTRINRGPLFLPGGDGERIQAAVLLALRNRWRFGLHGLLLLAPALPAGDESTALLRAAGFKPRKPFAWGSAVIDLQPSIEAIRAALSSKWRNHLNGSLKAGIAVRVSSDREAFDWMLEKHASNMTIKGFVGPSAGFVRNMIASSPRDFFVLQAYIDNQPVSAVLVARFGTHAETYLSWTGEDGRRTNAHHLLVWHAITELKAAGCRALDLGGFSTTGKYGAYKRAMKGREYVLCGEWLAF